MINRELLNQANDLRRSGQNALADKIYDQLLNAEPNNSELMFNKALNIVTTNPTTAISLFAKAFEIDNKLTSSFGNIVYTANQTGCNSEALSALNELARKYPNNIDLIYHKAVQTGNCGDHLKAILDFYFVLENSPLGKDAETFLAHQIATDIALCKTELSNSLRRKETPQIPNGEKLKAVKMKEYQYPLPARLFGDENFFMEFGKMMGYTIKEVIQHQPDYISWCILNLDNFCVGEDIIEMIKKRGVDVTECARVNLFKLKVFDTQKIEMSIDEDDVLHFPDEDEDYPI